MNAALPDKNLFVCLFTRISLTGVYNVLFNWDTWSTIQLTDWFVMFVMLAALIFFSLLPNEELF